VLNLLFKDLLILKKTFFFALFYIVFMTLVFQNPPFSAAVYAMGTVAVAYILMTSAGAYDEKNKSEVFLNSLPVRRREIVFAKYLAIFLYAALGLGGTALFTAALNAALPSFPVGRPGLPDVAGAFAGAVLLGAAYYPLCFKFGVQKVRLFQLFLFLLVFFLPPFAVEYLQARSSRGEAAGLAGAVLHAPAWVQGSAGAALLLAVLLGSLALSLRIYERKEF